MEECNYKTAAELYNHAKHSVEGQFLAKWKNPFDDLVHLHLHKNCPHTKE